MYRILRKVLIISALVLIFTPLQYFYLVLVGTALWMLVMRMRYHSNIATILTYAFGFLVLFNYGFTGIIYWVLEILVVSLLIHKPFRKINLKETTQLDADVKM